MPLYENRKTSCFYAMVTAIGMLIASVGTDAVQPRPQPPKSLRLYVFDCGTLEGDPARFNLKREEMATTDMSVACYLVVHPNGTLIWDTSVAGQIATLAYGTRRTPRCSQNLRP